MIKKTFALLAAFGLVAAVVFTNSILAGTTLVRDSISSEGFQTGVTGWSIKRNGDAEFNSLISRGRFVGGTPGGARVDINQFNTGTIQFYTGSPSEQAPAVIQMSDASPALALVLAGPEGVSATGMTGASQIAMKVTAQVNQSDVMELTSNDLQLNGKKVSLTGAAIDIPTPETWHPFSLVNGWVQVGATVPQYRKDLSGNVIVEGRVSSGTTGTIATLPAGYRPVQLLDIALKSNNDAATMSWVQINTTGTINVVGNVAPAQTWLAINFMFSARQ